MPLLTKLHSIKVYFMLLASLFMLAAPLQAQDIPAGRYFAPSLSYHMFGGSLYDDELDVDSEGGYGLAIGYRFDSPWAVEVAYHKSETEYSFGNNEGDLDSKYPHLDLLYHYTTKGKITPYGVAGVGERSLKNDLFNDKEVQVNMGAGMAYALSENFHVRSDARLMLADDATELDALLNIGLVFSFGKPGLKPMGSKAVPVESRSDDEAPSEDSEDENNDSDNDGVANDEDKCPDTSAGAKVDNNGCYITLEEKVSFNLNVKFRTGSAELDQSSTQSISELADFLKQYPSASTVIEGHTDSQGAADLNKRLSQQRADSVRNALINEFGVDSSRVQAIGYGEEQPIADNDTAEGRAQNRRVVAEVGEQVKQ